MNGAVQSKHDGGTEANASPRPDGEMDAVLLGRTRNIKELVASTPNQKNWKGILIALVVIGCVCSLIILSVLILTPEDLGPRVTGSRFTLSDVIDDNFKPPDFKGHWISGTEIAFKDDTGGISILDVETLNAKRCVQDFTYRRLSVQDFWISSKKKYVLFRYNTKNNKKHRQDVSYYAAMEMASEQLEPLTPFEFNSQRSDPLQFARWLPNSESLLMVYRNDIYLKRSPRSKNVIRITFNGKPGVIYNGVTNLLYQDFIFHRQDALWLSSSGIHLCYAVFNDTKVSTVHIPLYTDAQTNLRTIRYPMVDSPNPTVQLKIVKLEHLKSNDTVTTVTIQPPSKIANQEHYVTDVKWIDDDYLSVVWRNRVQNISVSTLCHGPSWECGEIMTELSGHRRWVLTEKVPLYGHNMTTFVTLAPLVDGSEGTHVHVYQGHVNTHHNTPITYGDYSVFSVVLWDTDNNLTYYIANTEKDPASRHLWRVTDINSEEPRIQECVTCGLNYSSLSCKHFTPYISSSNIDQIILHCEGPSVPHTILYSIPDNEIIYEIQMNVHLSELSSSMAWPKQKDIDLQLEDQLVARVRLLMPPEVQEEEGIQKITIIMVDGIPGEQVVNHKWKVDFSTFLASNRSWNVVHMDVRGSGGESAEREYQTAWNLGHYESLDYLSIVKYLSDNYKMIDKRRIGIWAKGHGAYNALKILTEDSENLIACTAAISPITDWKMHASYYTEKFMGTSRIIQGGNFRGYEESTLQNKGKEFTNKNLILIHGTADSRVLYSQMLKFSGALISRGVMFGQMSYTDEGHSLERSLTHLYDSLEEYFLNCFPPLEEEEIESLLGN